jgi:D-alanine-D-alanine ligase
VFIALHGRDGEDGTIQSMCEAVGVAYTGSSPLTCRLCFDKSLAKRSLEAASLPVPAGYVLSSDAVRRMGAGSAIRAAAKRLGFPLVVKPAAQGSALGLAVVRSPDELTPAVVAAFDHGDRVLLEQFVAGREISISLVGRELAALPPVEINTRSGVFDFETRVSPGAFELTCPSDVDDSVPRLAVDAAHVLGVRGFGRVDMRMSDDGPLVLDVKTCPGLTETSIVPLAASAASMRFEDFVVAIVEMALERDPSARA